MRRVLFVTYYYPPSGGPGVQRSLKFTRYLPEFGWMPDVLTVRPENASYPDLDPDLGSEIPGDVEVTRTRAWDPYAVYARVLGRPKQDIVTVGFLGEAEMNKRQRLARWIRANLFLPDARVGWVPFATARGSRLLRRLDHDVILTTGPPHSTHLIGLMLASIHRKPWLVDFRDPWTEIDYYADLPMTPLTRHLDQALERIVLRKASAGTVVSSAMRRQLRGTFALPLEVIENGFDPADFEGLEASPPSDRFVLAHIGNLNAARNPTALWRAVRLLRASDTMRDLRIVLVGNVEPAVLAAAAAIGVDDIIELLPYVPHDVAIRRMLESSMLLLSINRVKGAEGIITGKVYEYVASGRPVLGIGPREGDAAGVLRDSGAGMMFDFEDSEGVAEYLRGAYDRWKSGEAIHGATVANASRYSRREQSRRLAELLGAVGDGGSPISDLPSPQREAR